MKALADSESKADDATDGTVRGTGGGEVSLGASGSSGVEWSGVDRGGGLTLLTPSGRELRRVQHVVTLNLRGTDYSVPIAAVMGCNTTTQ